MRDSSFSPWIAYNSNSVNGIFKLTYVEVDLFFFYTAYGVVDVDDAAEALGFDLDTEGIACCEDHLDCVGAVQEKT